jgi:hypothetical protein
MQSVEELRKSGHRVRVTHRRYYCIDDTVYFVSYKPTSYFIDGPYAKSELIDHMLSPQWDKPLEKGGSTQVDITTPDGKNVTGIAGMFDKRCVCS